jgi:hypothetical protein
MDITTLGYSITVVPATILGLVAGACILLALYELAKLTARAYRYRYYAGLVFCLLLWWLLIGIALIVIGDLT